MKKRELGTLKVSALGLGCMGMSQRAWLLNKGDHFVPIPGTKKRLYLEEHAKAAELELTSEDMKLLELTFPAAVASR